MQTKPTYKQLEKELEIQKISHKLLDISKIVRFVWSNLEGWPVDNVSKNVENVFGFSKNDFVSGKIIYRNIIHSDDIEKVDKESLLNLKSGKKSFEYSPYRIINKSGDTIWVKEISLLRINSKGEITHFEGIISDITEFINTKNLNEERKEKLLLNKKIIKQKSNLYQTSLDAIDALVYVSDIETHEILFLNRYGIELFGYKIGQKCYEVLQKGRTSPCEFCTNHLLVDKNGNANEPYIWEHKNTSNNKWFQCRDQAIEWDGGKLVRIEIATDITEIKAAELIQISKNDESIKLNEKLFKLNEIAKKNEIRYKNLFESNPISLWDEDFGEVKLLLDEKAKQVPNIEEYIDQNPKFVDDCASKIKIIRVNQSTLDLLKVNNRKELVNQVTKSFNDKSYKVFKKELVAIANNTSFFEEETEFIDSEGNIINAIISFVANNDYARVVVSISDITAIKIIEQKLKNQNIELQAAKQIAEENEERFWKIFENMPSGVAVYKPVKNGEDFEIVNINKKAEIITNSSRKKLIGSTLLKEFPLMNKQPLFEALKEVNLTGKNMFIPSFFYNDKDREGWRENFIYKLSSGEIVAIFKDITDIKNAEFKLKQKNIELQTSKENAEISEKKYRLLISNTKDTIWTTDINFKITYCNDAVFDFLGYTSNEIIGMNGKLLYTAESLARLLDIAKETIVCYNKNRDIKQTVIYVDQIKKNNSIIHTEIRSNLLLDDQGNVIGFQGRSVDITQQKNIEKELSVQNLALKNAIEKSEHNEIRFKSLIDNAPGGVIITNIKGVFTYSCPYSVKFLKYSMDEIIGHNGAKFIHPEDVRSVAKTLKFIYKKPNETSTIQYRIRRRDGIYRWLEANFTNLLENKSINGLVINYKDITEQKLMIEELVISKKKAVESDKLKTEFINNMSHEIRTPMNGILGFSDLLHSSNLTNDKRKQYVQIIQNSGNTLLRIIDDILEISRLGTKQVKIYNKEICLNNILLEQFSIFGIKAKENSIPLYLKKGLSDNRSKILVDETKLTKIISNLLENSLKFTHQGYIEFGYYLDKEVTPSQIVIYVKDTGIGIKEENQKIIFERFSQEEKELSHKVSGLGLGLSIAKENAELLGGSITLQSEKNKGTTFFVRIPYNKVESENNSITDIDMDIKNDYTVLIAEDEDVNFLFIDTLLESYDLNIITIHAKNGAEAVEICSNNNNIDLILMDIKMPVLNGYDATIQIKEFLPNIPIVAQTAYSTNEDRNNALDSGCIDFISKPIDNLTLKAIIDKYLVK